MKIPRSICPALSLAAALAQTACVGSTPASTFYLLEPLSVAEISVAKPDDMKDTLVLAPIRVPDYLDRPQFVTASGKNTYRLDEFHRWAERLQDNITRVMRQDLAALLQADVVLSNSHKAGPSDLRLVVSILEFHIDPQGQAVLVAHWRVSKDGETIVSEQNSYRLPSTHDDVPLQVQALNQCLNRFSQDLVLRLKTLNMT
ncbi:MAG: PqiC family protein [Methylomonas sp.]|nr:PqiC family protein [Methylomonas sp.]